MKDKTLYLLLLIFVATSCRAEGVEGSRGDEMFSLVQSPEIPEEVVFADETVSFDRYDLRERMDRELISFCYMHSTTLLMIKRANRYLPEVERILREEGLPDDFKYLMLIESNCNPLSVSGVGAAGLWQFMPATAREYGLEVSSTVDERYHIEKSTRAACAYLRDAYRKTGCWFAAAASYNAGQGGIVKQMQRQDAATALDIYLNSETSRYMFRIMAAKVILSEPERYGFCFRPDQLYPPFDYTVVMVDTAVADWALWAKQHKITYAQLRDANPWIRSHELVNKSGKRYEIRILTEKFIRYDIDDIRCLLPHCR